jgi:hypothetical protein
MKIFLSGIMQGSTTGPGIQGQDYRKIIRQALKIRHSAAEIVDPHLRFPDSPSYDDLQAKQVLFQLAEEAGSCDYVIAYLPEASMGSALEMIRAYDRGGTIISISPMAKNWVIRAFSKKIFPSLEDFCTWIQDHHLSELKDEPCLNT